MKCSECGNNMKRGFLQSSKLIFWSDKKRKMLFEYTKKDDVKVSKYGFVGVHADSYYCATCKYIRTEIRDED